MALHWKKKGVAELIPASCAADPTSLHYRENYVRFQLELQFEKSCLSSSTPSSSPPPPGSLIAIRRRALSLLKAKYFRSLRLQRAYTTPNHPLLRTLDETLCFRDLGLVRLLCSLRSALSAHIATSQSHSLLLQRLEKRHASRLHRLARGGARHGGGGGGGGLLLRGGGASNQPQSESIAAGDSDDDCDSFVSRLEQLKTYYRRLGVLRLERIEREKTDGLGLIIRRMCIKEKSKTEEESLRRGFLKEMRSSASQKVFSHMCRRVELATEVCIARSVRIQKSYAARLSKLHKQYGEVRALQESKSVDVTAQLSKIRMLDFRMLRWKTKWLNNVQSYTERNDDLKKEKDDLLVRLLELKKLCGTRRAERCERLHSIVAAAKDTKRWMTERLSQAKKILSMFRMTMPMNMTVKSHDDQCYEEEVEDEDEKKKPGGGRGGVRCSRRRHRRSGRRHSLLPGVLMNLHSDELSSETRRRREKPRRRASFAVHAFSPSMRQHSAKVHAKRRRSMWCDTGPEFYPFRLNARRASKKDPLRGGAALFEDLDSFHRARNRLVAEVEAQSKFQERLLHENEILKVKLEQTLDDLGFAGRWTSPSHLQDLITIRKKSVVPPFPVFGRRRNSFCVDRCGQMPPPPRDRRGGDFAVHPRRRVSIAIIGAPRRLGRRGRRRRMKKKRRRRR